MGVRVIVLRLGRVPFIDATGLATLQEVIERFRGHGIRVILCGVHPQLREVLEQGGVVELLGPGNLCANLGEVAQQVGVPA